MSHRFNYNLADGNTAAVTLRRLAERALSIGLRRLIARLTIVAVAHGERVNRILPELALALFTIRSVDRNPGNGGRHDLLAAEERNPDNIRDGQPRCV